MGIDHRPRKGGHGRHAEDGLPRGSHCLRQSQDVVARRLSRSQPQTSSGLLERIPIPVQQTLARGGPLLARPARSNRRGSLPLSTSHCGANRIGREFPIRRHDIEAACLQNDPKSRRPSYSSKASGGSGLRAAHQKIHDQRSGRRSIGAQPTSSRYLRVPRSAGKNGAASRT